MYAKVFLGWIKDRCLPGAASTDVYAGLCPFWKTQHGNPCLSLIVLGISHTDTVYGLKRYLSCLNFHPLRLPTH